VAFFFATVSGLSIYEWEPRGVRATVGELQIGVDRHRPMFVEVKSSSSLI